MSDEKNVKPRTIKLYDDECEEFKKLKSEQGGENVTVPARSEVYARVTVNLDSLKQALEILEKSRKE
jgi:hypothetical protein